MTDDLKSMYDGCGLGLLDAYDGFVTYRLLDEKQLSREISDMYELIQDSYQCRMDVNQDLARGKFSDKVKVK